MCVGSIHVTPLELIISKCSRKIRILTRNETGLTDEVRPGRSWIHGLFVKKKKKKNKVFNTAVGSVLDVLFPDGFRKTGPT